MLSIKMCIGQVQAMKEIFYYKNQTLYVENVAVEEIVKQYSTPVYIYSKAAIQNNFEQFYKNFKGRICYAVKANSNIAILNLLAKYGSGFDIVSQGELERVLVAGGDPQKIVFSGVGKSEAEIIRALQVNIYCFNVESEAELERIHHIASTQNKVAHIALRINPNIDAKTHRHISTGLKENKFGVPLEHLIAICKKIKTMPHVKLIGIACHIGSQLIELQPFLNAIDQLLGIVKQLEELQIHLKSINIGGGLGIKYENENPPSIEQYLHAIQKKFRDCPHEIIIEPGRAIIGNAGILITKVEYLKNQFAIVDAGMNDFMRPLLYEAWHEIAPVKQKPQTHSLETHPAQQQAIQSYDIVGPVCESADIFAKKRLISLQQNDLLAIFSVGAYGFSMSSHYNSRPRLAEIMVDGNEVHLIRTRETIHDLFALEKLMT